MPGIIQRRALQGAGAGLAAGLFRGAATDDGGANSGFGHYARNAWGGAALGGVAGAGLGMTQRPALMARQGARRAARVFQAPAAQEAVNQAATGGFNFAVPKTAPEAVVRAARGGRATRPAVAADRAATAVGRRARSAPQPAVAPQAAAAPVAPAAAVQQPIRSIPSGPVDVRQGGSYATTPGAGSRAWAAGRGGNMTGGGPAQNGLTPVRSAAPSPAGRTPGNAMTALDQMGGRVPRGAYDVPRPLGGGSIDVRTQTGPVRTQNVWGRAKMSSYRAMGKAAALNAFMGQPRMRYAMRGGVEALPEVGHHAAQLIERAADMPFKHTPKGGFSATAAMAAKAKELKVPGIEDTTPLRDAYAVLNRLRGVAA